MYNLKTEKQTINLIFFRTLTVDFVSDFFFTLS